MVDLLCWGFVIFVVYSIFHSYFAGKKDDKILHLNIELEMEKQRADVEKKYKKLDFYSLYDIQQGMLHKYEKKVKTWKELRKEVGNRIKDLWDSQEFVEEYARLVLVTNMLSEKYNPEIHNDDLYYIGITSFDEIEID